MHALACYQSHYLSSRKCGGAMRRVSLAVPVGACEGRAGDNNPYQKSKRSPAWVAFSISGGAAARNVAI